MRTYVSNTTISSQLSIIRLNGSQFGSFFAKRIDENGLFFAARSLLKPKPKRVLYRLNASGTIPPTNGDVSFSRTSLLSNGVKVLVVSRRLIDLPTKSSA